MKTKIFLLAGLCLLVLAAGMGCEKHQRIPFDPDPHSTLVDGVTIETKGKALSELTDEELRLLIEKHYGIMNDVRTLNWDYWTAGEYRSFYAQIIQVYQKELLLRQGRGQAEVPTPNLTGIWYSTSINRIGEWEQCDCSFLYPSSYPARDNRFPFQRWTSSYDFREKHIFLMDTKLLTITTQDGVVQIEPYTFRDGVLKWGNRIDKPTITDTLLIFKRDWGYWVLSREGEVGTENLTYEEGIHSGGR